MSYLTITLTILTFVYCCVILWIIVGFVKVIQQPQLTSNIKQAVKISIIIPVRNEVDNIQHCLASLERQNYPKELFEIIVVNDHSTDNTEQIVRDFIQTTDLSIRLVSLCTNSAKKEALKTGIALAKNDIISTTDADCILPQNWLTTIANNFDAGTDMLLGPVIYSKTQGFLAAFQTLDLLALQGVGFGTLGVNQPTLNNAANLSYTKKAHHSVNGFDDFDTPSGDDIFLLEKFKKQGKKVVGGLTNDFIVETKPADSYLAFFNQRVRWASKSKHYTDKFLLIFSGLMLCQQIALVFSYGAVFLAEHSTLSYLILICAKWMIDFILLFLVAHFFNRKRLLVYFIPTQIVYPLYILLVWIASTTIKFEWKGRKY